MEPQLNNFLCPICNEPNSTLMVNCRRCSARIAELIAMQKRILDIETASKTALENKDYADAFRAFSILLEYKPNQTRYLKGMCRACHGLGQNDYALPIIEDLSIRLKADREIAELKELFTKTGTSTDENGK